MVAVTTSSAIVTRLVRRHMALTGLSQADLGALIKVKQTGVSARLAGTTRWQLSELDALAAAGVLPPPFPAHVKEQ